MRKCEDSLLFSGKYQEDYRGGYSGYGYRSYSFPGGGKVLSGYLRIVSSIYIDYKYIINIYL